MPKKSNKNNNKKNNSLANLEKNNPLSKMNPISQANLMKANIEEINNNLKETIEILYSLTESLNIANAPCEVAKFVTDKVCTMKNDFGDLSSVMSIVSLDNIKKLANNSFNISKNLLEQSIDTSNIGNNLSSLVDSTSNMANQMKLMKGGGNKVRKNNYKYIINPYTGRKVSSKGIIGKQIILEYINNNYY
mgnify:CR=1 FL=1|tara:strand:+ start:831 stop:1403 length:573 start_codon:yes stop_codon:yes gene_type:complete